MHALVEVRRASSTLDEGFESRQPEHVGPARPRLGLFDDERPASTELCFRGLCSAQRQQVANSNGFEVAMLEASRMSLRSRESHWIFQRSKNRRSVSKSSCNAPGAAGRPSDNDIEIARLDSRKQPRPHCVVGDILIVEVDVADVGIRALESASSEGRGEAVKPRGRPREEMQNPKGGARGATGHARNANGCR